MEDKLLIARNIKKTIEFIEKTTYNFPNNYKVLKDNIINSCYDMLELCYLANINQEIIYKKKILVKLKMLNYYLKRACDYELITKKRFVSYGRYLLEIHNMVSSWCNYETN